MPKTENRIATAVQDYEVRALVLQGGGALGAYQAGVFEGLAEAGIELTDLAGISIGALNVAVIAGNPPEKQVERLHEFWDLICQPYFGQSASPLLEQTLFHTTDLARQTLGALHASSALMIGQKGFFRPRFPPAFLPGTLDPACVGYYDTRPLKDTLETLCDFDRINDRRLHVSVGAVNVRTGNFTYFDNHHTELRPEHFMASGALPPAFPAIEIEGEYYWDGGLVSNTPLAKVLEHRSERDTLVFQVDLWSARGQVPHKMDEVNDRIQDIRYSSRTRLVTDEMRSLRKMQLLLRQVLDNVPAKKRDEILACRKAAELAASSRSNIIHLIYRDKPYEQHFRDFQFGLANMREHWASGLHDIHNTLAHPSYLAMPDNDSGFVTHDVHRDEIEQAMESHGRVG
ncbi:MAG: patatin-like phospholipase family protein [Castellaniella sp.]|uniref:patatin-like phospholipase family protein n=1 Tax=Castellaniella sp. TaxID=1955812 RepID=UPI00121698D6|nr:patatin-like phospholipase family protein [Castellaniella sp.]TAN27683.1 MAG: patatin-like phospholipase family protein [Castellaniella sp.]